MDERIVAFRVGVMVLATMLLAAILALLFGDVPSLLQRPYTVNVKFTDAPGVGEATPVRKRGILIGRVTQRRFHRRRPGAGDRAIDGNRRLHRNEICYVRTSLLGDAMLQFQPAEGQAVPKDPIKPGETIQGAAARDALQVIRNLEPRLDEMMKSVTTTSDELGTRGPASFRRCWIPMKGSSIA